MTEHPTSVRLGDDAIARLDRISEALSKRTAGLTIGRSRAIKLAVERGIPLLEEELGLSPKRKSKK